MTITAKEWPVLFSSVEVLATISGQMTQFWRPVNPQPRSQPFRRAQHCPYGVPGDRLWVRETWQQVRDVDGRRFTCNSTRRCRDAWVIYAAMCDEEEPPVWRPSIHMPRWACRLVLEVTDVRVELRRDRWVWVVTFERAK